MSRSGFLLVLALLFTASLSIFSYKAFTLKFPLHPNSVENVWNVEIKISFRASDKPTKLTVFIPKSTTRLALLDESFVSRGFGLTTSLENTNRIAEWAIRRAKGVQNLFYRGVVRRLAVPETVKSASPAEFPEPDFPEVEREAAFVILNRAREESADKLGMVKAVLRHLKEVQDNSVALLVGKRPTDLHRLHIATQILALERIPVRLVHGVRLEASDKASPILHWLELHDERRWIMLDQDGIPTADLAEYLPLWRGNAPLATILGGSRLETTVTITRHEEGAISAALVEGKLYAPFLSEFSLFSLPLQTQNLFRVMLLLPLGALLVVGLRNFVGIPTFGTFMPVLVALAFRESDLVTGVALFSLVVFLGLAARSALDELHLLLVPRLAAVLTAVVIILCVVAVVAHKFNLDPGLSLALFPMVILTMTVERMSVAWEEMGPQSALKHGLGSLFSAILATLLLRSEWLEHLFFIFPELLLSVLAFAILLGRYTGYRLTDLYRFRALARGTTQQDR